MKTGWERTACCGGGHCERDDFLCCLCEGMIVVTEFGGGRGTIERDERRMRLGAGPITSTFA